MRNIDANFRHRPPLTSGQRILVALAAVAALLGGALFYHAESPKIPASAPGTLESRPPTVRLSLGADLWCLFDTSSQGPFGRPYPKFTVQSLQSTYLIDLPARPYPHELLLVLPAEKFLADEIVRQQRENPLSIVTAGPDLCQTHLALLMSTKTHDALLSSRATPLSTLSDWLQACAATSAQPDPVRFTMADPGTCSASWLGLADLLMDRFPAKDKPLASVTDEDLTAATRDLQRTILVQGISDRVEVYRFMLGGCPDDRVVLIYDHLAEIMSATGAFSGYAVVVPQLHFQPVVRAVVVTLRKDHLDPAIYTPTLFAQFQKATLPNMSLPAQPSSENSGPNSPTPDYATMAKVLKVWNASAAQARSP